MRVQRIVLSAVYTNVEVCLLGVLQQVKLCVHCCCRRFLRLISLLHYFFGNYDCILQIQHPWSSSVLFLFSCASHPGKTVKTFIHCCAWHGFYTWLLALAQQRGSNWGSEPLVCWADCKLQCIARCRMRCAHKSEIAKGWRATETLGLCSRSDLGQRWESKKDWLLHYAAGQWRAKHRPEE